jgi:hypothetical protein
LLVFFAATTEGEAMKHTGISNRESAPEEAEGRQQHPPQTRDRSAEASADRPDEQSDELKRLQTSHKAGGRSAARKEAESKYVDRTQPPSRKAAGAVGMEPEETAGNEGASPSGENVEREPE